MAVKMVDSSTPGQFDFQFIGGGVMIPVSPLQSLSRYSGEVTWVNEYGASYVQTFSFETSTLFSGPRAVHLGIASVRIHGQRALVTVVRSPAPPGRIQPFAARLGRHGAGRYRYLRSSARQTARFAVVLGPGRWILKADFLQAGTQMDINTYRVTIQ